MHEGYLLACRCGRLWRQRAQQGALQRSAAHQPFNQTPAGPHPPSAHPNPAPQGAAAERMGDLPMLESGVLISALLLNPTHELVRKNAVSLLKQLCLGTPHMAVRLVVRLAGLLPEASDAGVARAD